MFKHKYKLSKIQVKKRRDLKGGLILVILNQRASICLVKINAKLLLLRILLTSAGNDGIFKKCFATQYNQQTNAVNQPLI